MIHHPYPVTLITGPCNLENRLRCVSYSIIVVIRPHPAIVVTKSETHCFNSLTMLDDLVPVTVCRFLGIYSRQHSVSKCLGKEVLV